MKKFAFLGLLIAFGCGGMAEDEFGQDQQPWKTLLEDGSGTWGVDMTAGLPYPRCTNNGSANQDCRFLKPYSPGDAFTGAPSRYKINVMWGVGWVDSNAASDARVNINLLAQGMTLDLGKPQQQSQPVLDYVDSQNTSVSGVNIHGGTVFGSNTNNTDSFMSVFFNLCESNPLSEPTSVAGNYRPCATVDVTLDIAKLRTAYPNLTQRAAKMNQLYAKAIVTGLGFGRQEVVQGYPTNRAFNTQEFPNTGVYFTSGEKKAFQCISLTSSGGLHDFLVGSGNGPC